MIRNGKTITTPQDQAQVCIIGSGQAGITAAWELQKAGVKVILLDGSRELDYKQPNYYKQSWDDKELLYNGIADGVFATNESDFLYRPYNGFGNDNPSERERVYGGTSTHWGGQSRPLDPITFEKRDGFPGWPIDRDDLDPYYAKASTLCSLLGDYGAHGDNFTPEYWAKVLGAEVPHLDGFVPYMYQFVNPQLLNFATRDFGGGTIADTEVDVVVNASLLEIVHQGGCVSHLNVASMDDDPTNPQVATRFEVSADLYILACGAVANSRQLLLSGVGSDQVGHYFMMHPLSRNPIVKTVGKYMTPEQRKMMQGYGSIPNTQPPQPNRFAGIWVATDDNLRDHKIGRCWFWGNDPGGSSQMYFEKAPNYDSCIGLVKGSADPVFGQQQTRATWIFDDLDRETYETNIKLFNQSTDPPRQLVDAPTWGRAADQWTVNGHHIGGTRMSAADEPEEGVVDPDLKIHGMDNLYVAGSSVFPTAGISNPTMTIITLSIRLAEHVASQLSGGS